MKISIRNLIILLIFTFPAGCKPPQAKGLSETGQEAAQSGNDFISGQVTAIQQGKDGYTAQITTAGKQLYYATISHANLKDARQYRTVAVGDSLSVKGDAWKMENENHITVREIK